MIFDNRHHAGEVLAQELAKLKLTPQNAIIAAIPRGGVAVGRAIADILGIPLTAIVIKKIGAPYNAELAIGATASHGKPVLDRWLITDLDVSGDYLKKELLKKRKEARSREKLLNLSIDKAGFEGKDVIVVDDGLATGQTAKAAAKILRAFGPSRLILAVGCAQPSTIDAVQNDFDRIICPEMSSELFAVGQFYRDFRPVSDSEAKVQLEGFKSKIN